MTSTAELAASSAAPDAYQWAEPIALSGDSYAIGHQHGSALKERIIAFRDDALYRINRILHKPTSMAELSPQIDAYVEAIRTYTPALLDEIRGLADGAGMLFEEAVLLQIRREMIGYSRTRTNGDCTTFARSGPSAALGQTIDLNGNMEQQLCILNVSRSNSRRVLLLSFTGLLGYLGLNEDGVAIGLNLVLGGSWEPGIPPYLVIRHLLDNAGSAQECMELLRGLRVTGSRSLTICDRHHVFNVEILANTLSVTEHRQSVHANHFLNPAFAEQDQLNIFARNSSVRRQDACHAGLLAIAPDAAPQAYLDMFSQEPIYVPGSSDIRRERTVASVLMTPGDGTMWVQSGDQAQGRRFQFQL
ncbi:C45 family autoproteolytic acyltransferase/hydolase [Paraherbaspirillum soli]|uniref:C45 family autoproteolytic acyltransferase/hydrolase n=1 Tax=Paraherbaspirillum soli TaxID=631222 RepID=A0ABW0M6B9_9BURK